MKTPFDIESTAKVIPILYPVDSTGAAYTTEWICMKNYRKCQFFIVNGAKSSTSNQAVTLKLANDASGTKSAAITSASASTSLTLPYYYQTSSGDTMSKTSVSSSTFNLTKSSDSKVTVIKVDAEKMGTFISSSTTYTADYLALSVGTPGAHADLACVFAILSEPRYGKTTLPTAIT